MTKADGVGILNWGFARRGRREQSEHGLLTERMDEGCFWSLINPEGMGGIRLTAHHGKREGGENEGLFGTEDEEGEADEEDAEVDEFGAHVFFVENEDTIEEGDQDAATANHGHYRDHRTWHG